MDRYKTMNVSELGPSFAIVNVNGNDWNIVSINIEHYSDPFWSSGWDHGKPSNYEIELRGPAGAEMTLNVPPNFTFEVKVPEPWKGLKPGDLLSGKRFMFIYLGFAPDEPNTDEPYLMHIVPWGDHRPTPGVTGYSRWSWYEQEYGPLAKMTTAHQRLGLNYYRNNLGMKELTNE